MSGNENSRRTAFNCFYEPVTRKNLRPWSFFPVVHAAESLTFEFFKANYDEVDKTNKRPFGQMSVEGETGYERLKQLFSTDELGRLGPEWSLIVHGTYGGIVCGAVIGGYAGGKNARETYMKYNQATKFNSEIHAKRALQDRITLGLASGAVKYGLKMGAFSFLYIFGVTLSSVYRGKTNVLDFVAAGAVSGMLWRLMMGPKAMLISGIMGSCLGLFSGSITMLALYLTDNSFEELRYWHYRSLLLEKQQDSIISEVSAEMPSFKTRQNDNVTETSKVEDTASSSAVTPNTNPESVTTVK